MGHAHGPSEVARAPALGTYTAELQKTEATVLTFQRLSREEAESETVRKKNTDKSAEGAGKDPSPG